MLDKLAAETPDQLVRVLYYSKAVLDVAPDRFAEECGRILKEELGAVWSNTTVVLATEFGRTAATNGTRGTDHGTATAAFLLGGAVQGGRVVADWPGLSSRALYQERDLKPTTDLRSVLKGVLSEHMMVPSGALEASVFPDSADAKPIRGLMRS